MRLHKGFTLVELLVAAALFATVVVVAVNIFVLTLRKPLRQIDNQHVQEEINYVFELLSYQISQATIDYDTYDTLYGGITNPVSELYIDLTGDELEIFLDSGQIWLGNLVSGDKYPLSSTVDGDVEIDELTFYVYPTSDPTDPANGVHYQEAVVVYISGHGVQDPTATFAAQTFITFRSYVR
ncbi:MAG: hypothetical protein ACD_41C00016G0002 [uncultured bacterium]|nr:MAG: hypothetical protein ACD_41C00016G0002 [uncultured bacterium]